MIATEGQSVDRPTLLVVDDDPDIRMLLCELFRKAGYTVELASDGADAILFLEHNRAPDAIVLDLLMPGIVGSSVLAYLSSQPELANVPVAIVSSSPNLAPAGYALFKKPLQFAPLLDFVRRACDTRALGPST
ncbi:MAG TPA: response regulator [Kofleriaceae bacterium]|nr:response regulator [Kofleriaceae bacterium]